MFLNPEDAPRVSEVKILAHSGQAEGMRLLDIPVWLSTYIRTGTSGLEALPDYSESYAFVIENKVRSLQEMRSWISTLNPMKALSLQVAMRIRSHLVDVDIEAATRAGIPMLDAAEGFVSAAEAAFYGSAREINRWWIQTANSEYRGYIFLVLDREALDRQLYRLMIDNNFVFTQEEREIWMRTRF
jgi:hypothetical protein